MILLLVVVTVLMTATTVVLTYLFLEVKTRQTRQLDGTKRNRDAFRQFMVTRAAWPRDWKAQVKAEMKRGGA